MPKITNKSYADFQQGGVIELLTLEELEQLLNSVTGIYRKHITEGRALVIALYYTGARPVEVLKLIGEDIYKEGSYIKIKLPTAKRGVPRTISLSSRFKYVRELYAYSQTNFQAKLLFYNYRSSRIRRYLNNKGEEKEYKDISERLRYYVQRWSKDIRKGGLVPYFFRHNRFSQMANAGCTPQDIQFIKGGRTYQSASPYMHLSTKKSEELAKKIK